MLKHLLSTTFRRTALLVLMAFVSVAAYAQQIDMSLEKVTVRKALEHLQREYNYSVSVRSDEIDIDRVVSVKSQGGASLTAVLNQIFAGQDVEYSINGNSVSVKAKKVAPKAGPRKITGKVLDEEAMPLTGATVLEKGTTTTTIGTVEGAICAPDGTIYFSDNSARTLRKFYPDSNGDYSKGTIETVAGKAWEVSAAPCDGVGLEAAFAYPSGVCLASDGTLYMIDGNTYGTVRKISYLAD